VYINLVFNPAHGSFQRCQRSYISFTLQGGSFRGLIMKHAGGDCFPSAVFFRGRIQNTSADGGEKRERKLSETSPASRIATVY
jgi:hypothetical protein